MTDAGFDLMPASYDGVVKAIITAGWATSSDGSVESPMGHFAYFDTPERGSSEWHEMSEAVESTELPPMGWYVAKENSDGIIHVYHVRSHSPAHEAYEAEAWFDREVELYTEWMESTEEVLPWTGR